MAVDVLAQAGNVLTSVRIDQLIVNMAKGVAWGQYELDKVGVEITKMMGVPGTVSIGGEQLSMLEAGFVPSFYHFVDTILELKMEVSVREEQTSSLSASASQSGQTEAEAYGEFGMKMGVGVGVVNMEANAKAGFRSKTTSAHSRTVDAKHAQKYNQDLSATSSIRTKIVPVPAPELLVERIRILLERLRREAEAEAKENNQDFDEVLMKKVQERILERVDRSAGGSTGTTGTSGTSG